MEIEIFENKKELARYFGDMLVDIARSKERVYIALSGGSTPKVIFDILAEEYKHKIDWKSLVFFWGDER
ncbi:MAG TPA: 6-phosphogluconolactonase, partial [Marinilabiliaceae bacterium]|nr:6-phosphogluconolactonase [Marinilabiliaceae bacterium]